MAATEADKHIFVNNFKVDLNDDITKVSSITMSIPKIQATTGNDTQQKTYRPGRATFGNITFTGAEHTDGVKKIREWIKAAYDGKEARKDITVEVHDQQGSTVRSFNLMRCLPVAYSSIDFGSQGGAQTMQWVVEVRVQRVEIAK
jgi:phage tail-like protein